MAGLVPAISLRMARCLPKRDARVKPAHDKKTQYAAFVRKRISDGDNQDPGGSSLGRAHRL
jgi:hypothetical protein